MAGITTMGTTFNLPNFNGELFALTPTETPLMTMIGALTGGGEAVYAKDFEWQTYDLRAVENTGGLEGQVAPAPKARVRATQNNVVQIMHSKVSVSYTKLAAMAQRNGLANHQPTSQANELDWQVTQELKSLKMDMEHIAWNGTYAKPSDNLTARKTRGLLEAITTNVTAAGDAELTETMVLEHMEDTWQNGGIREDEGRTVFCNSNVKRQLTKIFITDKGYEERTRTHAGVRVQTIETDFGLLNIVLDRYVPQTTLALVSLEMVKPRFLLIPEKGFLFLEPLAKVGASVDCQIYGEWGLEYGSQLQHGKITGIGQI